MFVGFSILMAAGFLLGFVTGFVLWIKIRPYKENKNDR